MNNKELKLLHKAMLNIVKAQMRMVRELENDDLVSIGAIEDVREYLREAYRILKDLNKELEKDNRG